jgi:hypothetical protein
VKQIKETYDISLEDDGIICGKFVAPEPEQPEE